MRHSLFLIVFLCISCSGMAQKHVMDSLEAVLYNHKEADSIKLSLLNDLANGLININPSKGLDFSNQQLALATILDYKKGISRAYNNKAFNYMSLSEDSLALKSFQMAYRVDETNNHPIGMGISLYGMAWLYQNRADYNKAIAYYEKAFIIFKSLEETQKMAVTTNGIGISQMYLSKYPKAIESFLSALQLYERLDMLNTNTYASTLSNMGLLYNRMQDNFDLALHYYKRALAIYRTTGDKLNEAHTLGNMANTYDNLSQSVKAIELQKQAYAIYEELGYRRGIAKALTNMGIAYMSIDYHKALDYFEKTLPIHSDLDDKHGEATVLIYLAKTLLQLPKTDKSLTEAETYSKKAMSIAKHVGYLFIESEANMLLSRIYEVRNDYKNAFYYKTAAIKLQDSLMSQETKDEITRLEERYKYEKKELDIKSRYDRKQALAQAEIERQKLIKVGSILGGGFLLLSAGAGLVIYKRKRDAVAKKQEAEFKVTVANTELRALRAQMNPHFIFNSLNSIGDYVIKNDKDKAKTYLAKFAKLMRQTLEHSNEKEILLKEDLELLELYLQMENQRLGHTFTYTVEVDHQIDTNATLVPPMILQPFVENSIWHGISKIASMGHISVTVKKEEDMLVFKIEDNGVGFQKDGLHPAEIKKQSLGQNITQKRIDIINQKKQTNGSVQIHNKKHSPGVVVEVKLPLELIF